MGESAEIGKSFSSGSSPRSRRAHVIEKNVFSTGEAIRDEAHGARRSPPTTKQRARREDMRHTTPLPPTQPSTQRRDEDVTTASPHITGSSSDATDKTTTKQPHKIEQTQSIRNKLRTLASSESDAVRDEGNPNAARNEYFLRLGCFSAVSTELVEGCDARLGATTLELAERLEMEPSGTLTGCTTCREESGEVWCWGVELTLDGELGRGPSRNGKKLVSYGPSTERRGEMSCRG